MTESAYEMCVQTTQSFIDRALNVFFLNPVDPEIDDLPDYNTVIKEPMDLTTVKTKLANRQYDSPHSWYHDMCLIYNNAIAYHKETSIWGIIAGQLLHDFKRIAHGFQAKTPQEWADLYLEQAKKFGEVLSSCPVKMAQDPIVIGCVKRSDGMPNFPSHKIPELVSKLNKMFKQDEIRTNVLTIIKLSQKDFPLANEDGKVNVEVEKLKDHALNALYLYVKALE